MQFQECVKGTLAARRFVSRGVKDVMINGQPYGQFSDFIGYRLFLGYLFHIYTSTTLAGGLRDFPSPVVQDKGAIQHAHPRLKPLEMMWAWVSHWLEVTISRKEECCM